MYRKFRLCDVQRILDVWHSRSIFPICDVHTAFLKVWHAHKIFSNCVMSRRHARIRPEGITKILVRPEGMSKYVTFTKQSRVCIVFKTQFNFCWCPWDIGVCLVCPQGISEILKWPERTPVLWWAAKISNFAGGNLQVCHLRWKICSNSALVLDSKCMYTFAIAIQAA